MRVSNNSYLLVPFSQSSNALSRIAELTDVLTEMAPPSPQITFFV
jgi:hypothetical protein